MGMPTWVGAGAIAAATTGDVVPALPAGWQADDVFILHCQVNSGANSSPAAPSGWTECAASPQEAASTRLSVHWRRATASESAPTVTAPVGTFGIGAVITAYRGCVASGNPLNTAAGGYRSSNAVTWPGLTTTSDDCLIVVGASYTDVYDAAGPHWSAWADADLASATERVDDCVAAGYGVGLVVATGTRAAAGSIAGVYAENDVAAGANYFNAHSLALQGDATGPPPVAGDLDMILLGHPVDARA